MTLPLAAPPTSPTPGFWLTVDLTPKSVAAGSQPIRVAILGQKSSTGEIVANRKREVLSEQDVERSHGIGNPVTLAYRSLRRRWPNARVDVLSPTPSEGQAASGAFQVSGTPTVGYTGRYKIHGVVIDVPWNVGETATDFHARSVTYIGRYTRRLAVTASHASTPSRVLLTSKVTGPIGNDVEVSFELLDGAGGTIAASVDALSGGSTEPDFTETLAAINGEEYDIIGLCLSNADVESTTGNVARLETHIDGLDSGPEAKLQQGLVVHTGLRTATAVSAVARNTQTLEILNAQNASSLPSEILGEELGDRAMQIQLKISANRIGTQYTNLIVGSQDPLGDTPDTAESDAALLSGVSLVGYNAYGECRLIRAVTTYSQTPEGAQVLPTDCNEIDAVYQYAKDLRAYLPTLYAGVKVARDSEGEEGDLPEGVVEEKDIRSSIIARTVGFWIPKGILQGAHFLEKVANGEVIVRVNDTDETQVDIFIPVKPTKNLAKLGVYIAKDG